MSKRPILNVLGVLLSIAFSAPAGVAAEVSPQVLLRAGPLPAMEPSVAVAESAQQVDFRPELDPLTLWPAGGDAFAWQPGWRGAWTAVTASTAGFPLAAGDRAVTWLAFYAAVDRFGEVSVEVTSAGETRLYMDGTALGHEGAVADEATEVRASRTLCRGHHRVMIRVERQGEEPASLAVTLEPKDGKMRIETGVDPLHPVGNFEELRELALISGLSMSPDGTLLAYRLRERQPGEDKGWTRLNVVEVATGRALAASLGGSGSRALSWRQDSAVLMFKDGNSLFLWHRDDGRVERVLRDEPGLGSVSWSRDASFVVLSSTAGAKKAGGGNTRRVDLREKLTDWPKAPHLHLLMLESGARRRLTVPGDWSQDAFEIMPDDRRLLYLRNLPMEARPWFFTEFRLLDLATGENSLVARVTMGFENRPGLSGLAVSPDGTKVAFVGPPSELGALAAGEPSAFDPDLFVMNLDDGSFYRLTEDMPAAVNGSLRFAPDSGSIYFSATDGSRSRLVRATLKSSEQPAVFMAHETGGDRIHSISVAASGDYACVASSTDRLPALYVRSAATGAESKPFLDPNARLMRRLFLSAPVDASFTSPDGSSIEGWLYLPHEVFPRAAGEKLPLIAYFYGGATPTVRGYNELNQLLVGNGYAVFVCNPRGAHGYGQSFADMHVAEWGKRAGADIIAGVERVLDRHEVLDRERVGCYGGSYGGFMTMWLVSHCDLFGAAVSMYGISNLASYWGEGMWGYTYGDQAINRYPWRDGSWFVEHSPLFSADRINTPLLLLHGEADVNVPVGESEQLFTALRLLNRPVELVRFPGEDHGIVGTWENRAAHRVMLLEWFDRYLRDQPEAWEARWK